MAFLSIAIAAVQKNAQARDGFGQFLADFCGRRGAAGPPWVQTGGPTMTIAEYCLFAAVLLYLAPIGWAKGSGAAEYKNGSPRDPEFYQTPQRARALGAHQNGLESFPFFLGAVLLAEFRAVPQGWIDALAATFIGVRLAYVLAYVGDRPSLRTLLWGLGFAVNTAVFFLPAFRG
jgi:uncharacterized MAPEG superfamily protein